MAGIGGLAQRVGISKGVLWKFGITGPTARNQGKTQPLHWSFGGVVGFPRVDPIPLPYPLVAADGKAARPSHKASGQWTTLGGIGGCPWVLTEGVVGGAEVTRRGVWGLLLITHNTPVIIRF